MKFNFEQNFIFIMNQQYDLKKTRRSWMINKLEKNNRKLKTEITKLQDILNQSHQTSNHIGTSRKDKFNRGEQSYSSSPQHAINLQLKNKYKQIYNYEHQLTRIRTEQIRVSTGTSYKLRQILNEKQQYLAKLKKILQDEQTKTKKNQHRFKQLQKNTSLLNIVKQIQYERKILAKLEDSQKNKEKNILAQFKYITKLEKQLKQNGYSNQQVVELRKRVLSKFSNQSLSRKSHISKHEPQIINLSNPKRIEQIQKLKKQEQLWEKIISKQIKDIERIQSQIGKINIINEQVQMKIYKIQKQMIHREQHVKKLKGTIHHQTS